MLPTILLIIASKGYHPVEYGYTRQALEAAGIKVVIASDMAGIASARPSDNHAAVCSDPACNTPADEYPQFASAAVDLILDEINIELYDGIFIIGGPGAMEFLDTPKVYALMQEAAQSGKPFGAICVSPRILAHAGVLEEKKATGWNGDHLLEGIFAQHGADYMHKPVVIDGKLVTGNGPDAAQEFGTTIVELLV